jgi:hypothetical protein
MNWLIDLGVRVLEVAFVLGCVGTVLVLVLSAIEDLRTLTEREPRAR